MTATFGVNLGLLSRKIKIAMFETIINISEVRNSCFVQIFMKTLNQILAKCKYISCIHNQDNKSNNSWKKKSQECSAAGSHSFVYQRSLLPNEPIQTSLKVKHQ